MNIMFLISIVFLLSVFMVMKKNNERNNFLLSFLLTIVLYFAYNSFVIFLFSIFNITSTMLLRSLLNIFLGVLFLFNIIKSRKIQTYYIKLVDVIAIIVIIAFGIFIGNYRFHNDLTFDTTDPSVHFYKAEMFYKNSTLSMDIQDNRVTFYNTSGFDLFSSYTSLGTVFQLFSNSSSIFHSQVFVIFEIVVFISSGCLLYLTITKYKTKIISNMFIIFLIIFYLFGYPLSNMIFGFHYLGLSILIINSIIYLLYNFYNVKTNNSIIYILSLCLLNFYLFSMYYLFVPILYGAEGLYIIYQCFIKKNKKIKSCLIDICTTLFIPFIIGIFIYFIYPKLTNQTAGDMSTFELEGYIYRNLIGNFLMLIPFVIYAVITSIKKKSIEVMHFMIPFILIFMLFVFYKVYSGSYATYYYYKFYYLLSFIFVYIIANEIQKEKFNIYSVLSICLITISLLQFNEVESKITNKNFLLNPVSSISSVDHVLQSNQELMKLHEPVYTSNQLKDLDDIFNRYNKLFISNKVVSNLDLLKRLWIIALYDVSVAQDKSRLASCYEDIDYDKLVNEESDLSYFLTSYEEYEKVENKYKKKFKEFYQNDSFILLELEK